MATLAFSSAGSKLKISTAAPTAETSTAYALLTYTEVKEVTDLGMVGPEKSLISHNPVGDNVTYKLGGTRNFGSLDIKGARAPADPGQALLIAAEAGTDAVSVQMELADGSKMYFSGLVLSYKTGIGGQGQITGFESKIEVNGAIIDVAAA
jgi:hypothetical protein